MMHLSNDKIYGGRWEDGGRILSEISKARKIKALCSLSLDLRQRNSYIPPFQKELLGQQLCRPAKRASGRNVLTALAVKRGFRIIRLLVKVFMAIERQGFPHWSSYVLTSLSISPCESTYYGTMREFQSVSFPPACVLMAKKLRISLYALILLLVRPGDVRMCPFSNGTRILVHSRSIR